MARKAKKVVQKPKVISKEAVLIDQLLESKLYILFKYLKYFKY